RRHRRHAARRDAATRLARGLLPVRRGTAGCGRSRPEERVNAVLIARNTFREAARDRMLIAALGAGAALLSATQLLAPLALGEGLRLTVDLGLSGITFIGLALVLLVGTSMVAKEIDKRTIFNLLARPVSRRSYLVG